MGRRYAADPRGVTQLRPRSWIDSPTGARLTLAAFIGVSLLLLAAITRAVLA